MKFITYDDLPSIIPIESVVVASHAAANPYPIFKTLLKHHSNIQRMEIIHMVPVGEIPYCQDAETSLKFRHNSLFAGTATRKAIAENTADYTPVFFSRIPQYIRERKPDIFFAHISNERNGKTSLGISVDYGAAAMQNAKIKIAILNPQMPYTFGDGEFNITDFDYIIKDNFNLPEVAYTSATDKEKEIYEKIASHIVNLIEDGSIIQIGIGELPNAILEKLTTKNDLGLHSEMISDGIIKLIKNGNINNSTKKTNKHKSIVTFAMGTSNLYKFLDQNESIIFKSVEYVNDPYVIASNDKVISINSALQVDLMGQVNAEMLSGMQISGVGGQVDFVRGATLSKNGKSIIALPSTNSRGDKSRIVGKINSDGIVTTTRNDVDYVCTEYGCVKLSGQTLSRRKELLISIAHPDFREELRKGKI